MEDTIRLSGVVNDSIVDGPGIRLTIFVQGCPHHCKGCHNPQTHAFDKGYSESIQKIIEKVAANPLLKGITLSGGEPFCQPLPLLKICSAVKEMGKDVWAYSGYIYEELIRDCVPDASRLLERIDVLVDGPFLLEQQDLLLQFRGSKNQRIIDVKRSLAQRIVCLLDTQTG